MLSVSLHASSPDKASRFNRLARLDIVYERLSPVADYKVALLERNCDPQPPRRLTNYPRWSSSLWDLVARSISISLPEERPTTECVPPIEPGGKKSAFILEMCAILEHASNDTRNTLGLAHIRRDRRCRGRYTASFEEHTVKPYRTEAFPFAPAFFRPSELLLHACLHRLTGEAAMPARPGLCSPKPVDINGVAHIQIHELVEPARTGFRTWLSFFSEPASEYPGAPLGVAPEEMYVKFLCSAI